MCLTINKPFFTALICGKCLDNVHGKADYSSCFEIGGSQMEADKPCGRPPIEPQRSALSHELYCNNVTAHITTAASKHTQVRQGLRHAQWRDAER